MNPSTDLHQMFLGELERTIWMFYAWFWDSNLSGSTFNGKKAKIVIYDHARVTCGSYYEYPGQRWVLKLAHIINELNRWFRMHCLPTKPAPGGERKNLFSRIFGSSRVLFKGRVPYSINQSIHPSINQSINQSTDQIIKH